MNKMKKFTVAIAVFGLMYVQVGFADEGQNNRELGELELAAIKLSLLKLSCPHKDKLKRNHITDEVTVGRSNLSRYFRPSEVNAVIDQLKENSDMKQHLHSEIVEAAKNVKNTIISLKKEGPPEYSLTYYLGLPASYLTYCLFGNEYYDPAVEFEQRCNRCEEIYNELVELAKE